jgi:signal transduction histidine kinase
LTLIIILIFWLYRTKNRNLKLIEEKNVVIEQANIELEHQNDLILNQNQELSNLNSVKDKFFSIISHDMRNPVTNLTLLLSIIESYFQKGEYHKIPEKFEKFKQSINSLMYLFDNLLMWSRTQTGSMQFNKTKINLSQTLVSVAETFELNMETKNIELQIDVTDNILLEADKDMIEFVIRNLLSNSLKFTSPGGRVSISLENAEESVILSVADTGIGMSKESIEKLFKIDQKYSRVGTANEKGSGLGLTIVKEFTDLHQATIEIASNLGDGTTVRVLFPKTNILI